MHIPCTLIIPIQNSFDKWVADEQKDSKSILARNRHLGTMCTMNTSRKHNVNHSSQGIYVYSRYDFEFN